MNLSPDEILYLRAFGEEAHKRNSSGYLDCEEAGKRSNVNAEGGRLATRLAGIGYLEQRKKGYPEFRITPTGARMLVSWWKRNLNFLISIAVTIMLAVLGWLICK